MSNDTYRYPTGGESVGKRRAMSVSTKVNPLTGLPDTIPDTIPDGETLARRLLEMADGLDEPIKVTKTLTIGHERPSALLREAAAALTASRAEPETIKEIQDEIARLQMKLEVKVLGEPIKRVAMQSTINAADLNETKLARRLEEQAQWLETAFVDDDAGHKASIALLLREAAAALTASLTEPQSCDYQKIN